MGNARDAIGQRQLHAWEQGSEEISGIMLSEGSLHGQ